jgi:hypothetical protein
MKRLLLVSAILLTAQAARAESTYVFDMKNGLAPWASWMPVERTPDGVQMTLPGRIDSNHMDGIGPLWLLAHLRVTSIGGPGVVDFDQSELTIRIRAHNLQLHGARLLWWLTRQLPREDTDPRFPWQETNWALTCCDLSPRLGEDWQTITVKLDKDPSHWTYAGTNLMHLGDWGNRYVEYPLDKVLNDSVGSLHLAIVGNNATDPPTGTIEISSISLRTQQPARPLSMIGLAPLLDEQKWDEARWHLERLMPTDDPRPNYELGRLLAGGLGGKQDYRQAAEHLEKAMAVPGARLELAKLYIWGLGVPKDQPKAVQLLETKTTPNIPEASYTLGLAYSNGIGVEKNEAKAISLFQFAAERGHPHAMHELARRLIDTDPAKAYYWYRLARERLPPDLVGAESQLLDWNIAKLTASLPRLKTFYEEMMIRRFQAIPSIDGGLPD